MMELGVDHALPTSYGFVLRIFYSCFIWPANQILLNSTFDCIIVNYLRLVISVALLQLSTFKL